ncbi:MAG: hypothetical protein Q8Q94_03485 [bacterium]|nr:hypothetical protein [bacterium]MDZ4299542.1 hypothetical protein [Candidatus Sungbacteria bacterium]
MKEPEPHQKKSTDGIRLRVHHAAPSPVSPVHHDEGRLLPSSMLEHRSDAPPHINKPLPESGHTPSVELHPVMLKPLAMAPSSDVPSKEEGLEKHDLALPERAALVKKTSDDAFDENHGNPPKDKPGSPHKGDTGYPLEDKRFSWLARPKFSDQVASQKHFASLGPKKSRRGRRLVVVVLAILLTLAGGVVLLSTVFARVTVAVKPRIDDMVVAGVPAVFDMAVHSVLTDQHLVPAERLEITKKVNEEFPATGRANVSEHAHGRVILTNQYSSLPQPLVATTRFLTDAGVLYRLPKAVVIPGAKIDKGALVPQSVEVELVADVPGEGGNHTGALTLTIPGLRGTPKYAGFSATAPDGFTGGKLGDAVVVTAADLKQAQDQLTKKVMDELNEDIRGKLPPGFIAPDALRELKVIQITAPAAQSATDRFSVAVEARARILAVRPDDIALLIEASLEGGNKGRTIMKGASPLNYYATTVDFEKGRAEVVLRGSVKIARAVDTNILRELIAGKSQEDARALLSVREEISAFRLSFFPPWSYTIPVVRNRVSVVLE